MIRRLAMLVVIAFGVVFATCSGLYCLGRLSEGSHRDAAREAAGPPPIVDDFALRPVDSLPARINGLAILSASGNDRMLEAYYDYLRPDIVHVYRPLRTGDRPFEKYDVRILCNLGWPGGVNQMPICVRKDGGQKSSIGARPVCIYRDERPTPKMPEDLLQGASIAWTDLGWCSIDFKHGMIRSEKQMKDALRMASEAASWMDQFVPAGRRPAPEDLAENRRAMEAGGRAD